MNPTSKKFLSLFLVFSLMMLSVNLYAKERQGANLIITKKDGQQIEGELIAVKPISLLLLDAEGKDVSIGIADMKVVRIVKKSKAMIGSVIGVLIGGGVGALFGELIIGGEGKERFGCLFTLLYGGIGVLIGAGIGTLAGRRAGKDKIFRIGEMTDSEIQETMDKLHKKARVRDYK